MPQSQLWDLPGSGADSFVEGFSVNRSAQGGLRRSRYDRNREVKLAFYADDLHTKPAEVACTTNGVSVSGNEVTVSGDSALARIDQGTFTLDLTYDLGRYMTSIGKTEIPNVGTYLYAEAWAEGQIGGTGGNQRLPEYDGSDSEASVHMTGALARTGEQLTMDVTQGNDGNGHSTAAITLRNNCLQSQTIAELVATLVDAAEAVLETKKASIGGAISGETFRVETVTFSRLGTRVVVRAAVPGNDLLTFEGLAVGLDDFTANGTNYTYTLQNDSGATSTLVTAVSGNGEPVSINGQALSTGGSATVAIPNSDTGDIVVGIGAKTYTLTILRNSGTGGNEGGGGSGYSYYTIKATAGPGGSISPSGSISVREGRDQTFTITPDKGYAVANVKIDSKSIGAVKSYTFENVRRTHTIEVIFVKGTASASTGDSIRKRITRIIRPIIYIAVLLFAMTTAVMGCYLKETESIDIPGRTPSGTSVPQPSAVRYPASFSS